MLERTAREPAGRGVVRRSQCTGSRRNQVSCRAGEAPGQPDGLGLGLLLGALPVQEPQHLRVPQRAGRRPALPQPGAASAVPPRTSPASHIRSTRAAIRSSSTRTRQRRGRCVRPGRPASSSGSVAVKAPGQLDDLQRADDPAPVRRQDRDGRGRGERREPGVQRPRARTRRARPRAGLRTAGSVPGNCRSSSTARTYSPEPPTSTGVTPPARQPVDRCPGQPLVPGDAGRLARRPRRRAGDAVIAAALGRRASLAVPMSMPRYSCIESALTTSPPSRLGDGDAPGPTCRRPSGRRPRPPQAGLIDCPRPPSSPSVDARHERSAPRQTTSGSGHGHLRQGEERGEGRRRRSRRQGRRPGRQGQGLGREGRRRARRQGHRAP